ncbi:MAG: TolC family protein [Candidatus Eisenbacteria bacterium]|jgi:outer membrane protein TolC|nr:TolC family protein [Candidatus Eisenbacteria bacterium]
MNSAAMFLAALTAAGSMLRLDLETAQRLAREQSLSLRTSRLTLESSRLSVTRARAERFLPQLDLSMTAPSIRQYTAQQVDPESGELALYARESRTLSGDLALNLPLPTDGALRLTLSGQRWEDAPRESGTGDEPTYTSTLGLSLEQPILDRSSGAGIALHQADLSHEIALASYQREELELDYRVAAAFLAAVRAQEQARIDSVELNVAMEYADLGRRKLASGLLSKGDALDLQLREATTRASYLSSTTARTQTVEDLLLLLGLDLSTPVDLRAPEPQAAPRVSLDKAVSHALQRRREMLSHRLRLSLARSRLAQTRQSQGPVLTLSYGVDLVRRDTTLEPAWEHAQRDQTLRLGLSFPLLEFGRRGAVIRQASIACDQEDLGLAQAEQDIIAEVRATVRAVATTQERASLLEQALGVAQENYDVANARFESGTINSQQLQDAQLALFRARTNLLAARVDLDLALRRLQKVTHARIDELAEPSSGDMP